jgi:methylase of polypeptide subunit release factors
LSEAEAWSHGPVSTSPCGNLTIVDDDRILAPLRRLDYGPMFLDILPYACEVFETSEEVLKHLGGERVTKRRKGIFYTPSDVADYLVEETVNRQQPLTEDLKNLTWFDPAVGTGCLLQSVLYKIANSDFSLTADDAVLYSASRLFGTDVSPAALQSAVYGLIVLCHHGKALQASRLHEHLTLLRDNFALVDATTLNSREDLSRVFPALKNGASCLISNPPYSRALSSISAQASLLDEQLTADKTGHSLYLRFLPLVAKLCNQERGSGAIVVPLSLAYSTHSQIKKSRVEMLATHGSWWLAHFDRTPDSLFGDDVKTRNTIVTFAREPDGRVGSMYSSDLIRWSSRSRESLFNNICYAPVSSLGINGVIPKTGTSFGQSLAKTLGRRKGRALGYSLNRINGFPSTAAEYCLRSATTAYNWLPVERLVTAESAKYQYWKAETPLLASAAFAVLHSRISYWLWRVWGDGFHLTDRFITSLPFALGDWSLTIQTKLADLGDSLWSLMLTNQLVSKNAGVERISYCPYNGWDIIGEIDRVLVSTLDLPSQTTDYLDDYVSRNIVAGRDNEISSNPALRRWNSSGERQ